MDWTAVFKKGIAGVGTTVTGLIAAQLAAHQGMIVDWVTTAVAGLVAGAIVAVTNWLKHRED